MICAPASILDAPEVALHGPEYRAAILKSAAVSEAGTICIEEAELADIRSLYVLPPTPRSAPSLPQRARSLAAALLRWLRSGCPLTTEHLYRRRTAICAACPHWRPPGGIATPLHHCALCGCATALKLRLFTERCPDQPPRW